MVIGIFAGVGSGKSLVLDILSKDYGAYIIEADKVAHRLYKKGNSCYKSIINLMGRSILDADGAIDRVKLSNILYHDRELFGKLESIVHPLVWQEICMEIKKVKNQYKLIAVEAAVLPDNIEIYDELWYIYSDLNTRIERLKSSRGYDDKKIQDIIKKQPDDAIYREFVHRIIKNTGDIITLKKEIAAAMGKE